MRAPGYQHGQQPDGSSGDQLAQQPPTRINLGEHSAGSAAATIRRVGELLGYVVVASGPASFRLTRPVRRGIRRVDQVVSIGLTNERDGLWVTHDGPVDPRLIEQLQSEARVDQGGDQPSPPPVANLPRPDTDLNPEIVVRPGAAPRGLIDTVPGSGNDPFPPPRLHGGCGLIVRLPDGRSVAGDDGLVIGRDPEVSLHPRCRTRVAIGDPGLSKTHVAVWVDGDVIMIEDLHSTNGSGWATHGEAHRCEPGQPVAVPADRVNLLIGSAPIVVERAP